MVSHLSPDPGDFIVLGEARQNNLKGVSLRIPKGRLTVFTGVSGSGKSSLVFGTIAVESQRQMNETYPAFIRNRLPKYERPAADVIENLSTAIVIDQRPVGGNARSTVGTMTEVHAMLRVLFSRHGMPSAGPSHMYSFNDPRGMCPRCEGLGSRLRLDLDRLLDEGKSLNEGAIRFPAFAVGTFQWQLYAESGLFDPDLPLREFSADDRELLLHGSGFKVDRAGRHGVYKNEYEGVVRRFTRRYLKAGLDALKAKERAAVEEVVTEGPCEVCGAPGWDRPRSPRASPATPSPTTAPWRSPTSSAAWSASTRRRSNRWCRRPCRRCAGSRPSDSATSASTVGPAPSPAARRSA